MSFCASTHRRQPGCSGARVPEMPRSQSPRARVQDTDTPHTIPVRLLEASGGHSRLVGYCTQQCVLVSLVGVGGAEGLEARWQFLALLYSGRTFTEDVSYSFRVPAEAHTVAGQSRPALQVRGPCSPGFTGRGSGSPPPFFPRQCQGTVCLFVPLGRGRRQLLHGC